MKTPFKDNEMSVREFIKPARHKPSDRVQNRSERQQQ